MYKYAPVNDKREWFIPAPSAIDYAYRSDLINGSGPLLSASAPICFTTCEMTGLREEKKWSLLLAVLRAWLDAFAQLFVMKWELSVKT